MGDLNWLRTKVGHENGVKKDSGHLRVFSNYESLLLHVLHTLILEVVHMVFFFSGF